LLEAVRSAILATAWLLVVLDVLVKTSLHYFGVLWLCVVDYGGYSSAFVPRAIHITTH